MSARRDSIVLSPSLNSVRLSSGPDIKPVLLINASTNKKPAAIAAAAPSNDKPLVIIPVRTTFFPFSAFSNFSAVIFLNSAGITIAVIIALICFSESTRKGIIMAIGIIALLTPFIAPARDLFDHTACISAFTPCIVDIASLSSAIDFSLMDCSACSVAIIACSTKMLCFIIAELCVSNAATSVSNACGITSPFNFILIMSLRIRPILILFSLM